MNERVKSGYLVTEAIAKPSRVLEMSETHRPASKGMHTTGLAEFTAAAQDNSGASRDFIIAQTLDRTDRNRLKELHSKIYNAPIVNEGPPPDAPLKGGRSMK